MSTDTRSVILETALACFVESSYEQTTIAAIRERSGVSNGALFHHFHTKEAIADALYVEAMASFQEGLWELLRRRPRSLRAAVRGTISHQLRWIEEHEARACFLYLRGHLDWDSPAGAELVELNRSLAGAYRDWMAPLVEAGAIRPMSMLMLTAIVTGPAHAIARRWLAGHLSLPLQAHVGELADAATAALSGTPSRSRSKPISLSQRGRIRVELLADDGSVLAGGQATAELLPTAAGTAAPARRTPTAGSRTGSLGSVQFPTQPASGGHRHAR